MVGPFIFVDEFGPARAEARRGHGRAPAPAHQPRHRDLSVRGRDPSPRQHRVEPGDRARRGQSDDRGRGHRPFRAQPGRGARRAARGSTGCRPGSRCPTARRRSTRRSTMCPAAELPLVELDGASARVLMGKLVGRRGGHAVPFADDLRRPRARPAARIAIDSDADERAILATEGTARARRRARSTCSRSTSSHPGSKPVLSGYGRAMLLGGQDFATPRHVWWNFVSSSRERINEAKRDWKAGRFPLVPGDDEEFIPIPEVPEHRQLSLNRPAAPLRQRPLPERHIDRGMRQQPGRIERRQRAVVVADDRAGSRCTQRDRIAALRGQGVDRANDRNRPTPA